MNKEKGLPFMRKKISIVLAASLGLSILAGCATGSQQTQNTSTGTDANVKTEATAPKAPTPISMSLRILPGAPEGSADINQEKWLKKLEEKTNIDFTIKPMPHGEFDQKMAQMFATNDIPDVVQGYTMQGKDLGGAIEAGIFMPLDDLLKQHGPNLLKKIPKSAWDNSTFGGKIYGIPDVLNHTNRRGTYIRTDLLKKTGLPVPKTVDEYLNVLREFKKLGVEYPYAARENLKYADVFFGAYDVYPYNTMYEKQGDQIVPKFMDTENMTKAIQVYKTMFDEGLISKEFATMNSTNWKNNINAGKAGIWNSNANELDTFITRIKANVPEAEVTLIASPVGPDGKGGQMIYKDALRFHFINAKAKNAVEIIKFFDWMVTDEATRFFNFGIEGENYKVENGKVVFTPPTDKEGIADQAMRNFFKIISDPTFMDTADTYTEVGRLNNELQVNIVDKEGRNGIKFDPELKARTPDVSPKFDEPAPVILNGIIQMIYGKRPISDWPKVVEEWQTKGGADMIKEATDRYNKKQGVVVPN
jgi:putative aldouronate transport system substrate-binding protein